MVFWCPHDPLHGRSANLSMAISVLQGADDCGDIGHLLHGINEVPSMLTVVGGFIATCAIILGLATPAADKFGVNHHENMLES